TLSLPEVLPISAASGGTALVRGDRDDHPRASLRRIGDRARSVPPVRLEARCAVLRLGSVEMDWRRARDRAHSTASRLLGALRARGARDAGTVRPTPA